jgi:hypothetical protein
MASSTSALQSIGSQGNTNWASPSPTWSSWISRARKRSSASGLYRRCPSSPLPKAICWPGSRAWTWVPIARWPSRLARRSLAPGSAPSFAARRPVAGGRPHLVTHRGRDAMTLGPEYWVGGRFLTEFLPSFGENCDRIGWASGIGKAGRCPLGPDLEHATTQFL